LGSVNEHVARAYEVREVMPRDQTYFDVASSKLVLVSMTSVDYLHDLL
jgi:hypothetical protein